MDSDLVKGKIVLCDDYDGNKQAYLSGAVGAIVQNTLVNDTAIVVPLPASSVSLEDCDSIKTYINSAE